MVDAEPVSTLWLLYVGGLVVSGAAGSAVASILWQYRDSRTARFLLLLTGGCAVWCFVLVTEILLVRVDYATYPGFYVLDALRYLGLYAIVFGFLFFVFEFTGRERYVTRKTVVGAGTVAGLVLVVILTNHIHGLFWKTPPVPVVGHQPGWGVIFRIHAAFSYSLLGLGSVMLLVFVGRSRRLYRGQAVSVLLAVLIPLVGNVAFLFSPAVIVDPTPIAFTLSGILLFSAIYRYQLVNVTPVAREAILDNMDEGVLVVDENERVTQANRAVREMLDAEEVAIGVSVEEFLPDNESLQAAVEELLAADTHHTREVANTDRHLSLSVSPMDDERDRTIGRLLRFSDVTERRERERELEQYTELVQTVGDPMYVLDEGGRFERVNDAFLEYADASRETILGSHATEFMAENDYERGANLLDGLVDRDRKWDTYEMTFLPAGGEPIPSETMVSPVIDDDAFVGTVGVIRDISDRKRREEQLDLLRQVFSRVLRHNLRNDMTIIKGSAETIAHTADDGTAELAEKILERSENLLSTSQNARDLEWVIDDLNETTDFETTAVAETIAQRVGREHETAAIATDLPESAPAHAHKGLPEALANLVENGIVHNDGEPTVRIDIDHSNSTTTITVTDDGPGIPAQEIEVLREERETSLEHGSGAGLWLVNFVVEESEGELRFEREDGQTTVSMRLPASA